MRQRASATAIVSQSSGHHRWDCGRLAGPRRRPAFPHNDLSHYHPKTAGHPQTGMHRSFFWSLCCTLSADQETGFSSRSVPVSPIQLSLCILVPVRRFSCQQSSHRRPYCLSSNPENPGSDSGCPRNLGQTPFCTLIDTISNPCYLLSQRLTSFRGGFRSCPQPVSAAQRRFFE